MNTNLPLKARIDRLLDSESSKVKAIATIIIGNEFAILGLKIIDSSKGLFVRMPQNSFQKDGKTEYSDIFHPLTPDARNALSVAVLSAYEEKLAVVHQDRSPFEHAPVNWGHQR